MSDKNEAKTWCATLAIHIIVMYFIPFSKMKFSPFHSCYKWEFHDGIMSSYECAIPHAKLCELDRHNSGGGLGNDSLITHRVSRMTEKLVDPWNESYLLQVIKQLWVVPEKFSYISCEHNEFETFHANAQRKFSVEIWRWHQKFNDINISRSRFLVCALAENFWWLGSLECLSRYLRWNLRWKFESNCWKTSDELVWKIWKSF